MPTFKGQISVDGIEIYVKNNDSDMMIQCVKIANELIKCHLGVFVSSISWKWDESDPYPEGYYPFCIFINIGNEAADMSPAMLYIAKTVFNRFDGNLKISVDR